MTWFNCLAPRASYSSPMQFRTAVGNGTPPRAYSVTFRPVASSDVHAPTDAKIRRFPVFLHQTGGVITAHDARVDVRGSRMIVRDVRALDAYLTLILKIARQQSSSRAASTIEQLNEQLHPRAFPSLEYVMTNKQAQQLLHTRATLYQSVPHRFVDFRYGRLPITNWLTLKRKTARARAQRDKILEEPSTCETAAGPITSNVA